MSSPSIGAMIGKAVLAFIVLGLVFSLGSVLQHREPIVYDCAFERLTPPSGYIVNEREIRRDTTYVIVEYRGRSKALRRDQMIQCEEVPDGEDQPD